MTTDATGPTIEALRALFLFAEEGESKTVGNLLGVHASGISRRLRPFRKAGLLKKMGSGLALTERGRQTLPALRCLLRQYDQLARWLKEQAREPPQALVVATGAPGAAYYLPPALALLRNRLPSCAVRVHVCRGRERIRGVADGSFDLAIVSHDADQVRMTAGTTEAEAGLQLEALADHSLCLLARQQTDEAQTLEQLPEEQTVLLTWLARFELVGLDPRSGLRRQLEQRLRAAGLQLRFGPDAGGWQAAREYARCGLGVALMPLSLLEPADRNTCVLRRLPSDVHVRDHLIRRHGDLNEGQEVLCQSLREAAREREGQVRARWQGLGFG
jgi:DNA-binding transcriptional LysR family regulator